MTIRPRVPALLLLILLLLLPAFRWAGIPAVPAAASAVEVARIPDAASAVEVAALPAALPARGAVASYEREGLRYHLYTPSSLQAGKAPTVLVTLAGFGGNAEGYLQQFIPYAEQNGWVLLSPQLSSSGAWRDVGVIRADARRNLVWLHALVESLHSSPPLQGGKLLLYGFSLGSQNAHRFALAYPGDVAGAALMSAGTYTLPASRSSEGRDLLFPFGARDLESYSGEPFDESRLRSVPFWVGVGRQDHAPEEVPREWDPLLGNCRLDRAQSFAQALQRLGARVEMAVFQQQGHWETGESLASAMDFLRLAELSKLPEPPQDWGPTPG